MRVLVVAPKSDINNVADWVASARGHQLTVLNGTVSTREVIGAVASGKHQVVHFANHNWQPTDGCRGALVMSDGVIPEDLLEDAFRAAGNVELAIIGACASVSLGARLYMAGVPRTISWRVDVNDQIAGEWAKTFYESLGLNGDIFDATQTAAERVRQLGVDAPIYLNGRMSVLEAEVSAMRRNTRFGGAPAWLVAAVGVQFLLTLIALLEVVLR